MLCLVTPANSGFQRKFLSRNEFCFNSEFSFTSIFHSTDGYYFLLKITETLSSDNRTKNRYNLEGKLSILIGVWMSLDFGLQSKATRYYNNRFSSSLTSPTPRVTSTLPFAINAGKILHLTEVIWTHNRPFTTSNKTSACIIKFIPSSRIIYIYIYIYIYRVANTPQ